MKTTNYLKFAIITMALIAATAACKSKKQTTTYEGARGKKVNTEECVKMALMAPENVLRGSGNAEADREQFAINTAMLEARGNLARQLETMVNGITRRFDREHAQGNASSSMGKSSGLTQEYFEQFIRNSRPICQNTYEKENGKFNVYVCIEMPADQTKNMYKKLKADQKIAIDFEEHQFLKELEKAKEDYRKQQE